MNPLRVAVQVVSADPEIITRAAETFTRAATGMALEGVEICLTIDTEQVEDTADVDAEDD
jgi:hypothetical protein